ncbi:hypothetical protein AST01_04545 [Staphylococcus equorum]|uniref:BppU family phage baseplate upper protein n=1 Tax=Staphylococcus equorum TaxID=246432 RepID=UPI000853DAC8|nr:BppU family phage baseplate upper protein [Staphylococcus equorum]OEK70201.1 hypothetical protein AST01_04545 [Staphylococcus equorum]
MTNGIDKKALFKLKSEPYLKPISDLGVGFYNLDENTAILRFQLSNTKGPLLIHNNNLTAYAYFESDNGSASDVIELDIEDSNNGIVTITLDKEFLQASTSTKVKGQVYIAVNNVSGKPEYNEVAVFREFTFEVANALINKISSFTKIEYIRMFDQLKMRIEQKVKNIEEAIANGADYVAEMKSVLQQGVETLNVIVADGKTDIQTYITQGKTELNKVKTDAVGDINTTANNAKTSVQDTASTSINAINATTTEATEHVDSKVTEFNQTVEDNGFLSPQILDEELGKLSWQKYKLTNDDGSRIYLAKGSFTDVTTLPPGFYETVTSDNASAQGFPSGINNSSFVEIDVTRAGSGRAQIKVVMNYNMKTFYKTIHTNGADNYDWKEMFIEQSDTGWIPYNAMNGAKKDSAFKAEQDNGFDCAYRIIEHGNRKEKRVRINVSNVTHQTVVANLLANFAKNVQFHHVRVPINKGYGLVGIFPSGSVYVYIETDKREIWNETDYFYGEFSWVE